MRTTILAVAVLGLVAGCGSGLDVPVGRPAFLTLDDISDFPEGTALGDEFDGRTYAFVSGSMGECVCAAEDPRGDFCATYAGLPADGAITRIDQTGGFLSFEAVVSIGEIENAGFATGPGTLNADGTYTHGGIERAFNSVTNETIGQVFMLSEGRITDALLTWHSTLRLQSRLDGHRYDCQLESDTTYRRVESPDTP